MMPEMLFLYQFQTVSGITSGARFFPSTVVQHSYELASFSVSSWGIPGHPARKWLATWKLSEIESSHSQITTHLITILLVILYLSHSSSPSLSLSIYIYIYTHNICFSMDSNPKQLASIRNLKMFERWPSPHISSMKLGVASVDLAKLSQLRACWWVFAVIFSHHLGVSKNNGTPKSSILIGFSIINYPFWGTPIFWKHPFGVTKPVGRSLYH